MDKTDFFVPLIQGYVGGITSKKMDFHLLSRRSFMMGGTRYNSRGIDTNGYVANFVETEQIMQVQGETFTHIQLRGSLPFHWNQKGVKAKIGIHQSFLTNMNAFKKHIKQISDSYKQDKLIFLNLLGVNRGDENKLTDYLLDILAESRKEGI